MGKTQLLFFLNVSVSKTVCLRQTLEIKSGLLDSAALTALGLLLFGQLRSWAALVSLEQPLSRLLPAAPSSIPIAMLLFSQCWKTASIARNHETCPSALFAPFVPHRGILPAANRCSLKLTAVGNSLGKYLKTLFLYQDPGDW